MMNSKFARHGLGIALAGVLSLGLSAVSHAEEVVLKLQHFLPAQHQNQTTVLEPWAETLAKESNGRIKVEIYPRMQLGGKPPQLLDQVRDGLADIVWALPGYTAGRYPKVAAFELPFMVSNAEATSQALQAYYEAHAMDEFGDFKVLWFHTHARGLFHSREGMIETMEDLKGKKMRAPNRGIGAALEAMGASAVFMPVPALPEALSKGVVDGAVIPWEIVPPLKVQELAPNHTEHPGARGFYTAVFVLAMNKDKYESLPDDLKKVIDDNSGMKMAKFAGPRWDIAEVNGRKPVDARGNPVYTMPESEMEKMRVATQSVTDKWIADMGDEGQALYDAANQLLDKYSSQ